MFDDIEKDSVFPEPSREDLKRAKRNSRNSKQRSVMRYIGENMASYGCILIVLLLIGFIWTDMSFAIFNEKMLIDGIITIAMFIVAQYLMTQNGVACGKEYENYIELHKAYLTLRDEIYRRGITLMFAFCEWRVDVEYDYYIRTRCKTLRIDQDKYREVYSKMSLNDLRKELSPDKAAKVFALNQVKPIDLTPEILLTDGKASVSQGGVSESAEEYVEKKTVGKKHIGLSILTGFITILPVFFLHEGAVIEMIIYTVFKLVMLSLRMYSGYNNGAKAYNTVEIKHISDKMKYLNLYLEFLNKKIYRTLDPKYGVIEIAEEDDVAENCGQEEIDESGAGGEIVE